MKKIYFLLLTSLYALGIVHGQYTGGNGRGDVVVLKSETCLNGSQTLFYQDSDVDGFGNPLVTVLACVQPAGYVSNNTDCDDSNPNIPVIALAPTGTGTISDPYLIATFENLQWVSDNSSIWDNYFYYQQIADIDAAITSDACYNGGAGWSPIGIQSNLFSGLYYGNGHTISGLYINRPNESNIGLFGYTNYLRIFNLGLINLDYTGGDYCAGIVGRSSSLLITNCYSTGYVSGNDNVGGMVGFGTFGITNSYFSGSVSGRNQVGGLVGFIQNSTINNSYSTGAVSGNNTVGGLVGGGNLVWIENSYSTGAVSFANNRGGLVGNANGGTITNSFWDTQTSVCLTSAGGIGKTTAEMKTLSTFFNAGWDFQGETTNGWEDYWGINCPDNNGYPFLSWQGYIHAPGLETWYLDADNDSFIAEFNELSEYVYDGITQCNSPGAGYRSNFTILGADCNNNDSNVGSLRRYTRDFDGDGWINWEPDGDYSNDTLVCSNIPPVGYVRSSTTTNGDCDENNPSINPGTAEIPCNGIDDNCDGDIDENSVTVKYFSDSDGDGYGNQGFPPVFSCSGALVGYVTDSTDCDDTDPEINPDMIEIPCNGKDDNCSGQTDENNTSTPVLYYRDLDNDGYGDFNSTTISCNGVPSGYATNNTDCDDTDSLVYRELVLFVDVDGDGYFNSTEPIVFLCLGATIPPGYILIVSEDDVPDPLPLDCNDNNPAINPGATEICGNGVDDDCDGGTDEGCPTCTVAPATPGLIPGPAVNVCANTTQTYTITPVSGATSYLWTTTGDISLASGQGTTSATFNFGAGFSIGSVRVQAQNACGNSINRIKSIRATSLSTPGVISGPSNQVCKETQQTYTIPPVSGAIAYAWSVGSGDVTLDGSPSGTTATFNFGPTFTTGVIRVQALNACGGSGYRTLSISSIPVTPGVVTGTTTGICPNSTGSYAIVTQPGLNYVWSTTGDVSITDGQGTGTVTVSFGPAFTSGSVRVQSQNACTLSAIRSLTLLGNMPMTPGMITGPASAVCASSSRSYSIANVSGATGYVWSSTGDISITGGQGTTGATFAFGPTFSTGTIRVQSQNACGLSLIRSLTVTGASLSAPMSVSGPSVGVCAGTAGVSYTAAAVAGATGYQWSTTGDISIASGQGTTTATFDFGPTFTTGSVRVQSINACGTLSPVRLYNVRALPATPSVISGNLSSIVPGTSEIYSVTPAAGVTSYEWVLPANASITAGSGTNSITVNFAPAFTGGTLKVRALNACGATAYRLATLGIVLPFGGNGAVSKTMEVPLSIYPNPASNKVTIQGSGITDIQLYDVSGRMLQAQRYDAEYQVEFNLNYPAGVYFIQVAGQGWSETRKLVIQQ